MTIQQAIISESGAGSACLSVLPTCMPYESDRAANVTIQQANINESGAGSACSDEVLVEGKESLVYSVYVVVAVFDEVPHDNIALDAVGKGEARLFKER